MLVVKCAIKIIRDHNFVNSTKHGTVTTKPKAVTEYNKNMGAVEKADMIICVSLTLHKRQMVSEIILPFI